MKNKGWKILQIIQLIIFLCFSAFLFARTVDGHGTVQTLEVKLISFAIYTRKDTEHGRVKNLYRVE